jgi:hypothetical protein
VTNPIDYELALLDFIPKAGLTWRGNANELNAGKHQEDVPTGLVAKQYQATLQTAMHESMESVPW